MSHALYFSWDPYISNCGNYLTNTCVLEINSILKVADRNEANSPLTKLYLPVIRFYRIGQQSIVSPEALTWEHF